MTATISDLAAGGGQDFATFSHLCAVVDGDVQCWGAGRAGELGDGLRNLRRPLAVRLPPLPGVRAVTAGARHSCALASAGAYCWGSNRDYRLGRRDDAPGPRRVAGLPAPVARIEAGTRHTCAVAAGRLFCWGDGEFGKLGAPAAEACRSHLRSRPCSARPLEVAGLPRPVRDVAPGDSHTCAVAGEEVFCWGRHPGEASASPKPTPVAGLPPPVSDLAAGPGHTCAVADGALYCWGRNDYGQLGDGSTTSQVRPVRLEALGQGVETVAAGRRHSCAVRRGQVFCWGDDSEGQVGAGGGIAPTPRRVRGLAGPARRVAAGTDVSCAVLTAGGVACWGSDDYGQRGRGRRPEAGRPTWVGPWDRGLLRDVDGDGRLSVACLGDSNTETAEKRPTSWCELLRARLPAEGWRVVNRGMGGATATGSAAQQLAYALDHDSPDVVIASFGTNDLLARVPPQRVLEAFERLRLTALADGVAFFAALLPRARGEHRINADVERANALLRERFAASRVVDFASAPQAGDYADAVHMSAAGQRRRAERARAALLEGAGDRS